MVANLVERDPARPMKEATAEVERFHFRPQYQARFLKNVFGIRGMDKLLGDECVQRMPMLDDQRDKLARPIVVRLWFTGVLINRIVHRC